MFASKLMFASTGKNHCIAAANALQHCHQVMSKFIQTRTIHPKVISYDELVKMVSCNEAIPAERFASYPIMAAGGAGVNNALPLPPSSSMITTNFGSSNTAASGANVQKTFRLHLFYTFYSMRVKVAFQHLRKLLTQFLASSLEDFMNCFIPMSDVVDVLAILLFEHGGEMDEELRQQILTSNDRISASVLMHLLWKIVLQSMKGCKDCYVIDKFFFRSIYRQSDILYQCYQLVQEAKEASVQRSDQIYHEQALQQCFPLEVMKEIAELVLAVEDSNEVVAYFSNLLGSSENVCNTVNDSEAADGEISSSFDCQQGSANATESTKASPSTSYTNYFDVLQALFHPKYALQELRKLFDRQRVLIVSLWVNNTSSVLLWESLLLRKTKFEHLRNKVSVAQTPNFSFFYY